MYRVQLAGGQYEPNREVGLHYQIHRGIAVHHAAAIRRGEPLRVNVFVGGPPAMTVAAVMPLPEGLSELAFAGVLGRRRMPMISRQGGLPIHAEADFCITGYLDPKKMLPEGPFGDHLGYYSLAHDFPVLRVEHVYHRADAIWPFTVVGRPPQEDTIFGQLIHELTGPVVPKAIPGVRAVHAVDAAGVHPLLLAIGSERYVPYEEPAAAARIADAGQRDPRPGAAFAGQVPVDRGRRGRSRPGRRQRARVPAARAGAGRLAARPAFPDLHDDRHAGLHSGAAQRGLEAGDRGGRAGRRDAARGRWTAGSRLPEELGFKNPRVCLPGILVVEGPAYQAGADGTDRRRRAVLRRLRPPDAINGFPLIVVVDDSDFALATLDNFLWITFTRSNPAADVYGIEPFTAEKHWGCRGSLVIDARSKPHHAPPLVEDPEVTRRVDALAAQGGPLHGVVG